MKIRDLPPREQPKVRLKHFGAPSLSTSELLEILAGNEEFVGAQVLAEAKSAYGIRDMSLAQIAAITGNEGAFRIKAAMELACRAQYVQVDSPQLKTPEDVANLMRPRVAEQEVECIWVISMNAKSRPIEVTMPTKGSVDRANFSVADIFRTPIKAGATSIILVHNHPSGDCVPSPDDMRVTKLIRDTGASLEIELLDHMIMNRGGQWVSMKERALW